MGGRSPAGLRRPPIVKRKTGQSVTLIQSYIFGVFHVCNIHNIDTVDGLQHGDYLHSAEEDSEDSQELPVDPQAAVLATSASQV